MRLKSTIHVACLALLRCNHVKGEPLVTVGEVTYQGSISDSIEHFQHIKFAHDTSGARRFAPPEPFTPPPGSTIDATAPGPFCPQIREAMPLAFIEAKEMDEDCLHLHIARPTGLNISSHSKLPVIVWLHGGGVVKGSAYDPHNDPGNVIRLSVSDGQPVIWASLNYRLTIFGFAALSALEDEKSLNVGMRDQRLGFQWIKNNIAAFGGDPERIIAYGLSAGGTFISHQSLLYGGTEGVPFQQAWIMSGHPAVINATNDAAVSHTGAVAKAIGCGSLTASKTLQCLRKVPMLDLLDAALKYSMMNFPSGMLTFIPTVDNHLYPDSPSRLIRSGRFAKGIRTIIGWTQDDGTTIAGPGHLIQSEEDMIGPIKAFGYALSSEQLSTLFSLYPSPDFEEDAKNYEANKGPNEPLIPIHYFRLARILRDITFTCGSIDYSYNLVKHTRASGDPDFSGAWLYDLNQTVFAPLLKTSGLSHTGVIHGSDTTYIFNGLFPEGDIGRQDQELSEAFSRSLISFAYTGNPISRSTTPQPQFAAWPPAYGKVRTADGHGLPSNLNIQLIGGPWGTGLVEVRDNEASEETDAAAERHQGLFGFGDYPGHGSIQQTVSGILGFGAMDSMVVRTRKRLVQQQKLLQRCAYVNSLAEAFKF